MLMLVHACYLFVNSLFIIVHVLTGLGLSQSVVVLFAMHVVFPRPNLCERAVRGTTRVCAR